jgi:DNA-binding CsgD family transcriptional regulator
MSFSLKSNLFQPDVQSFLPPFLDSEGNPATSASDAKRHTFTVIGVLLLDSMGTVVFSDQRAKQYCERGEGLSVEAGSLQISTCDGRFRGTHLHRFALKSKRAVHFVPRNGKLPLEVRFLPLPVAQLAVSFLVCLVRDEEQERSMLLHQLSLQYRLSPSEVQLCFLIRDGHSLFEAAIELSTTYTAVRARLKRIFEKTGVQRQTDLVRLLLYPSASEMRIQNQAERDLRVAT